MLGTPLIALFLIGSLITLVVLASRDIDILEGDEAYRPLSLSPSAVGVKSDE